MRRIIDRKLYDTDRAAQIARYAPLANRDDLDYIVETLYKTPAGEYFVHTEDAGISWTRLRNETVPTNDVRAPSEAEALDWCEDRAIDGDIVVEEFEHLVEL